MDAVEYLKARERYWKNGNTGMTMRLEKADPEKAVCEIEKWAEKYPVKTMLMDFEEKHPNAPMDRCKGIPNVCPKHLGYTNAEECEIDKVVGGCVGCWNRPLEEEK
jgi:hypothetical protein